MKWLGQHIVNSIARFKSDVYLEDLSTTAETNVLVVDSDGLVSKSTSVGGDLTSIVAGTGLSGTSLTGPIPTLNVNASQTQITSIGTIETGIWQGDAIASAYLDADTAHLSGKQTFTGTKIFDGDKSVTPGDGAMIHVDTNSVTDSSTSGSGTAAKYTHVSIEPPRLLATNASVTTTNAATLYIQGPPTAYTNQTITNAYALWVDNGNARFDGNIDLEGDIDVNGTLETDALTIGGAAVLAQATTTAIGAVELATPAEATTGTDTTRAVTAAGLTAHVDDRYQYVFISNSCAYQNSDMSGDDYGFPKDKQGTNFWEFEDNDDTVNYDATSFSTDRSNQHKGHVLPYDCTLVGFQGAMSSSGNIQGRFALWTFTPGYTATSTVTCTRRFMADGSGTAWNNRAAVCTDLSSTAVDLNAGDIIVPSLVCTNSGESTTLSMSYTIVLKIKLLDL